MKTSKNSRSLDPERLDQFQGSDLVYFSVKDNSTSEPENNNVGLSAASLATRRPHSLKNNLSPFQLVFSYLAMITIFPGMRYEFFQEHLHLPLGRYSGREKSPKVQKITDNTPNLPTSSALFTLIFKNRNWPLTVAWDKFYNLPHYKMLQYFQSMLTQSWDPSLVF